MDKIILGIFAVITCLMLSGIAIGEDLPIWKKNDNTILPTNIENNTLLGRDGTTNETLEIDGTTLIQDYLYLNKSIEFSPDTGNHSIGYNTFFDVLLYGDDKGHIFSGGDGSSALLLDFYTDPSKCAMLPYGNINLGSNTWRYDNSYITESRVNKVKGLNDENTYIDYNTDQIIVYIGGVEFMRLTEGAVDKIVFNNGNYNIDYDFDTDNVEDALAIDSSLDTVGLNAGLNKRPVTYDSDTNLNTQVSMVFAGHTSNDITLVLPKISLNGRVYTFINDNNNKVTIDGNSNEHIDGELTQNLTSRYNSISIVSNKLKGEWFIYSDTR